MFLDIDKKPFSKTALVDDTKSSMTYGEIIEFSKSISDCLVPRSIIFVLCENCIGSVAGVYSFMENNAVPLLLNRDLDQQLLETLDTIYMPFYYWMPENVAYKNKTENIIFRGLGYKLVKTEYNIYPIHSELAILLTTSGSTGSPKLVRHSYKNINFSYKTVASFFGYTSEDNGLADLPMQYTMGLSVICSHLYAGAKVTLTEYNLMSTEFWNIMEDSEITDITGVPFTYEVFDKLRFFRKKWPSLRIMAEGGGRLSDQLFQKMALYAKENGKQFFATFGTTETTARLAYLPPEFAEYKIGSIGRAMEGGRLFLLDENKNKIETMEAEGELGYEGDNVTMGYASCRMELQSGDDRHGCYITGDIARRDADGCYYITGRSSRFLKMYGLRISLDQCERLIRDRFNIDCACAGNDKCMTIFVSEENMDYEIILDYISEKTHLFRNCFKIQKLDLIPRSSTGKILYKDLGRIS